MNSGSQDRLTKSCYPYPCFPLNKQVALLWVFYLKKTKHTNIYQKKKKKKAFSPHPGCPCPSPAGHTCWLTSCSSSGSEVHIEPASTPSVIRPSSSLFPVVSNLPPQSKPHGDFQLFRPLCNPHFFFFPLGSLRLNPISSKKPILENRIDSPETNPQHTDN